MEMGMSLTAAVEPGVLRRYASDQIVTLAKLVIENAFQPIVEAGTGAVFGYESLMRGQERIGFDSPIQILDEAERTGQLDDTAEHSRLAETLCASFVGAVHVATSLGEPDTNSRRIDDLLTLWLGKIETTVAAGAGEVP